MSQITTAVELSGYGRRPILRQPDSPALYLAAQMLCARLYHRGDAPLGIQGGFDLGALYVRSRDPDITMLLRGKRGRAPGLDQRWPTVADVRARARIGSDVADDQIADVIVAVQEHLTIAISTFGVH